LTGTGRDRCVSYVNELEQTITALDSRVHLELDVLDKAHITMLKNEIHEALRYVSAAKCGLSGSLGPPKVLLNA